MLVTICSTYMTYIVEFSQRPSEEHHVIIHLLVVSNLEAETGLKTYSSVPQLNATDGKESQGS